ncbi:hypothetical protein [Micromonospora sp. RV43]|uniref:hypothetical protein n=1 Tax=Micromonospora sp. RV43 TaxID=1661387 RepID=UPI000AD68D86|nr:hypothetical protein [Micromonospora sp. RV43]
MTNDAVNDSSRDGGGDKRKDRAHSLAAQLSHDVARDLVTNVAAHVAQQIGSDSAVATEQERYLRELTVLVAIRAAADDLATVAAFNAASNGAMYPAIGEAAGMTRQAARVRWPGLADIAKKAHDRTGVPGSRAAAAASGEEQ